MEEQLPEDEKTVLDALKRRYAALAAWLLRRNRLPEAARATEPTRCDYPARTSTPARVPNPSRPD